MNLGETIYRLRTERNMSQGDLADALEVSRQSVSKWENNSSTPELDKLLKLSELFSVSLDRLVGNEAPLSPAPTQASGESPIRQAMPIHKILGIILLCFGLVGFLLLTVRSGLFNGFIFGAPFITIGVICMVCSNNLPFKCCWCVSAVCAPVACLIIPGMAGYAAISALGLLLAWLAVLVIWTIIAVRKGGLSSGSRKVALGCIVCVLLSALIIGIAYSPLIHRRMSQSTVETMEAIPIATE